MACRGSKIGFSWNLNSHFKTNSGHQSDSKKTQPKANHSASITHVYKRATHIHSINTADRSHVVGWMMIPPD